MSFKNLGLSQALLQAIHDEGYTEPTPVQKQAIPVILSGQDVMAAAQTGTGKTAGFTLPLLQLLMAEHQEGQKRRPVRALILAPTRELAAQVSDSIKTYGQHLPLTSTVIFGGVNINPQVGRLKQGADIVVATPGRLLDLVAQKAVKLSEVEILVLDEADRMLDMGFIHDIRKVLALLPEQRQNLLFSATFSPEIKSLAKGILHKPALIEVARPNSTASGITQKVYLVEQSQKREVISHMIGSQNWRQVLIFTRTKHGANRLAEQLQKDGLKSAAIHGNKSQGARTKALAEFKEGKVRVLVATDIAARGLDIEKLPHVINFELPSVPEDYVHRIGRTGRAQSEGLAISLVSSNEYPLLKEIEKLLKQKLPKDTIEGYEPDATYKEDAPVKTHASPKKRSPSRDQNQASPRSNRTSSNTKSSETRRSHHHSKGNQPANTRFSATENRHGKSEKTSRYDRYAGSDRMMDGSRGKNEKTARRDRHAGSSRLADDNRGNRQFSSNRFETSDNRYEKGTRSPQRNRTTSSNRFADDNRGGRKPTTGDRFGITRNRGTNEERAHHNRAARDENRASTFAKTGKPRNSSSTNSRSVSRRAPENRGIQSSSRPNRASPGRFTKR